jgi:hypothetical protein
MFDLDLITIETIILMRDRPKVVVWAKRMKDAGAKAAVSRLKTLDKRKWKSAGLKAAATRKRNAAETPAKKDEAIDGIRDVEGTRSQIFVGGVRKPNSPA